MLRLGEVLQAVINESHQFFLFHHPPTRKWSPLCKRPMVGRIRVSLQIGTGEAGDAVMPFPKGKPEIQLMAVLQYYQSHAPEACADCVYAFGAVVRHGSHR